MVIERYKHIIPWFLLLVAVCGYSFIFFNYNVDDAAIYWRMSRNIVSHGIYSYNVENAPFDPASGTMYVLLGLIPEALGLDIRIFFKLVGIILFFLFAVRAVQLAGSNNDNYWKIIPAFALLLTPYTFIHAYSGLETILFSWLLFELFILYQKIADGEASSHINSFSLVGLLLALTRWEGIAIAILCFLLLAVRLPSSRKRFLISFAVSFLLPLAVVVLWRWLYFGDPLPTSYYFKSSTMNITERLHNFFWFHVERIEWIILVSALLLILVAQRRMPRFPAIGLVFTMFLITGFYSQSELFMGFAERFVFALALPLVIWFAVSINWSLVPFKMAIIPMLLILWMPHHQKERIELKELATSFSHQSFLNFLGLIMSPYASTGAVVGLDVAGAVPYYSTWHTVDYFGLCYPALAKLRGKHLSVPSDFLAEERIDLLLVSKSASDSLFRGSRAISTLLESRNWDYLGAYWTGSDSLKLYIDRNRHELEPLKHKLLELLAVARMRPIEFQSSLGFSIKPQGKRFDSLL